MFAQGNSNTTANLAAFVGYLPLFKDKEPGLCNSTRDKLLDADFKGTAKTVTQKGKAIVCFPIKHL